MTKASLLLAAAVAAVALGGCTSDTPDEPSGPGGQVAAPMPDCKSAPPSLIKELLGAAVEEPSAKLSGTVISCQYARKDSAVPILVRMRADATEASFASTRLSLRETNTKTADYKGLGDEAYTSSVQLGKDTTRTLVARKGSIEILVSSPATFDQEKAFILHMFEELD